MKLIKNIRIIVFLYLAFIFSSVLSRNISKDTQIHILLRLKNASGSVQIFPSALLYHKDFAYSLTFDDGLISVYQNALPLFSGGLISQSHMDEWKTDQGGDGTYSKGLFYSDGCGNLIPFRASIAINYKNLENENLPNRGYLSRREVLKIFQSGWGLSNHGYAHQTKNGTDYSLEMKRNQDSLRKLTGMDTYSFVIPGGEGNPDYPERYTTEAQKLGMDLIGGNQGKPFIWEVDSPILSLPIRYQRKFISSNAADPNSYRDTINCFPELLNKLPKDFQGKNYWINEFTHSVGKDNVWGLGLNFNTFSNYMHKIEKFFGAGGKDNIWFTSVEEVNDYLHLRDFSKISFTRKGNLLDIQIHLTKSDLHRRFKSLSLILQGDEIQDVKEITGITSMHYNAKSGLINLKF